MRLILLLLFLLSPLPAWAMGHLSEQTTNSALIGKAAPDAVLTKTDGTSASVIGEQRGKKVILVFWATWCPHCYEDLGTINENLASIEQNGIKVILVNVGETNVVVKNYFEKRQMKLISFVDEDSYMLGLYHLNGI